MVELRAEVVSVAVAFAGGLLVAWNSMMNSHWAPGARVVQPWSRVKRGSENPPSEMPVNAVLPRLETCTHSGGDDWPFETSPKSSEVGVTRGVVGSPASPVREIVVEPPSHESSMEPVVVPAASVGVNVTEIEQVRRTWRAGPHRPSDAENAAGSGWWR